MYPHTVWNLPVSARKISRMPIAIRRIGTVRYPLLTVRGTDAVVRFVWIEAIVEAK